VSAEPKNELADLLDRCRGTIERNLSALEDAGDHVIGMIRAALKPPATKKRGKKTSRRVKYDDKRVSHLAWLTIRVCEITTSLRQLEKHDRTMAKSPEQRQKLVEAYIRQLDPVRRAELGQLIASLAEQRSVLQ
jgi:hypothetical protein